MGWKLVAIETVLRNKRMLLHVDSLASKILKTRLKNFEVPFKF